MGECHYCFNCGRCRGETPPSICLRTCPVCRFKNEANTENCVQCGASLRLDPTKIYRKPKRAE